MSSNEISLLCRISVLLLSTPWKEIVLDPNPVDCVLFSSAYHPDIFKVVYGSLYIYWLIYIYCIQCFLPCKPSDILSICCPCQNSLRVVLDMWKCFFVAITLLLLEEERNLSIHLIKVGGLLLWLGAFNVAFDWSDWHMWDNDHFCNTKCEEEWSMHEGYISEIKSVLYSFLHDLCMSSRRNQITLVCMLTKSPVFIQILFSKGVFFFPYVF